jgi:hypothetical protein
LFRDARHLEVADVPRGLADTVPVRTELTDRDFVDVCVAVPERVDTGRHAGDEFRDDEAGVADGVFK